MEKNIFLLPTKESHLFYHDCISNYSYKIDKYNKCKETKCKHPQNIYITNDEKVEIGEYGLGYAHGIKNGVGSGWFLFKHDGSNQAKLNALCTDTKKVIITNDSELIKDGVQAVDDGFLVWFVDNPNSKVVKIEKEQVNNKPGSSYSTITNYKYKIIIPKEETKTNLEKLPFPELVKEFAEYYKKVPLVEEPKQDDENRFVWNVAIDFAKWISDEGIERSADDWKFDISNFKSGMYNNTLVDDNELFKIFLENYYQRYSEMYSEDDMINFMQYIISNPDLSNTSSVSKSTAKYYLKQFKKK